MRTSTQAVAVFNETKRSNPVFKLAHLKIRGFFIRL